MLMPGCALRHRVPALNGPMAGIHVLIVDDHPVVRKGLIQLLLTERDISVVGECSTAAEVLPAVERTHPHVLVLDLTLPDGDGLAVLKDLATAHPRLPVLVMTMHDRRVYADRCLRAGARGFLMKDSAADELVQAVRHVSTGRTWAPRRADTAPGDRRLSEAVATLSDRQLEVFRLVGEGLSTRDIAGKMGVSVKTVEAHKEAVKARIGATGAADLLRLALEWRETAG
jgi:two-component system response regulator NreC